MAGAFQTSQTTKTQFALPEFNDTAVVEHKAHVAKDLGRHDIIIGGNLLKAIGMNIKCSTMSMVWGPTEVLMKSMDAKPNCWNTTLLSASSSTNLSTK